jgi:hypothetical protein
VVDRFVSDLLRFEKQGIPVCTLDEVFLLGAGELLPTLHHFLSRTKAMLIMCLISQAMTHKWRKFFDSCAKTTHQSNPSLVQLIFCASDMHS